MITTQRKLEIVRWGLKPYPMKITGNYQVREHLVYDFTQDRGPFILNNYERAYADIVYREYGNTRTMEDLEKELMIQLRDEKINDILG